MVLGRRCFAVMDRAAHYREQANHARRLARAAWQLDLADMLRRLAKGYDKLAEDIEAGTTEIDHDDERRLRAQLDFFDLCSTRGDGTGEPGQQHTGIAVR